MRLPMMLAMPSTEKANICRGNSLFAPTKPASTATTLLCIRFITTQTQVQSYLATSELLVELL